MNILITGGAGYIGTLLIPELLKRDCNITVYDSFMWGIKPMLSFAVDKRLSIITGDVRDEAKLCKAVQKADLIIHLAAIVGYPACAADPSRAVSINVDGTRNVVRNISPNQRLIFASTGSTYGKVDGICTEDTPIAPLTLYGSTKSEAEKLIIDCGGVSLRFATVFGISPRLRLDLLINDFCYQAIHQKQIVLYEGHFRRTFLHCRDAALSYLFAIDNYEKMTGASFNIGDNSMNFTKRDIAHIIKEKIDYYLYEADFGEDLDKRDYEVSYEKINQLGYETLIGIHEGIDELIKILTHIYITNEWRNA